MFVGPFFYLDSPRVSQKGLLADPCPAGGIKASGRKRKSPVTHEDLLAHVAPGEDPRDHPRGEVIYDLDSNMAIIYIDRCIEKHLDQVVRLFELPAWVVEYDERYVCPRCDHLTGRF
jgi:hypothetical protein